MNDKKAVIFDLDGTLWDVTESTYISANRITQKYGLKEIDKETICRGFGTNKEESAKLYFPYLNLKESLKYIYEIGSTNIDYLSQYGGILFENEKEIITLLSKKYDLYIVSNTSRNEYIEAFLNNSGIKDCFKKYLAASMLNISKGEAIKKIIIENNINKAVYIGDTKKDQIASKEAQVEFIQAKYGFGEDLNYKYSINKISELPELLEKVF
ncbi:MAG: HAD family hydrolase [Clostridia bacterium]|nr:HAD family hydrolase [Clostridia bacterium]